MRRSSLIVPYMSLRPVPQSGRLAVLHEKDHLARFAGSHRLEALLELIEGDPVGDDRGEIDEAGPEGLAHLLPGVVHAPTDDTVDRDPLEDDVVREVDRDLARGKPEELHAPAVADAPQSLADRVGMPRHDARDVDA